MQDLIDPFYWYEEGGREGGPLKKSYLQTFSWHRPITSSTQFFCPNDLFEKFSLNFLLQILILFCFNLPNAEYKAYKGPLE